MLNLQNWKLSEKVAGVEYAGLEKQPENDGLKTVKFCAGASFSSPANSSHLHGHQRLPIDA